MPIKKEPQPDKKLLAMKGMEYDTLKKQEKEIGIKIKDCRIPLEEAVKTMGVVTSSGSRVLELPYADVTVSINHTLRTGTQMLPEAIDIILKEKSLKDCVENIPTIRMDRLEALIEAGKVSDDLLKKMFVPTETFAFSVKIKKGNKDDLE